MNKKTKTTIIIALLMLLCLCVLCACQTQQVSLFEYDESELGLVGKLVRLMHQEWIGQGNYGWTVVIFTVFLKIVMLPLDIWQRYSSRKSAVKMEAMRPVMEDIDKRYGANSQRGNEEKQKLYKKQGYSMLSTCLPMILSMVIFFVMFGGLNKYSTYSSVTNFKTLSSTYADARIAELDKAEYSVISAKYDEIKAKIDAETSKESQEVQQSQQRIFTDKVKAWQQLLNDCRTDTALMAQLDTIDSAASQAVKEQYLAQKESWLWIQNVWQPDTWSTIMPDYDTFSNSVNMEFAGSEGIYNKVRQAVLSTGERGESGSWNGLMILPILSIGLSFLSLWISQRVERKNRNGQVAPAANDQQAASNKMMMIMMPLMMALFGFMYTGAFAIYMVVNYSISILSTLALRAPVEKMVQKNIEKSNNSSGGPQKANYER